MRARSGVAAKPVNWLVAFAGSVLVHFLLFVAWELWPAAAQPAVSFPGSSINASINRSGDIFVFGADDTLERAELVSIPYTVASKDVALVPALPPIPASSGVAGAATPGAVLGPNSPGGGVSQGAAFFGVPVQGRRIVFVIDASASMGRLGRFDRARRELGASLERLPPDTLFQVITYNDAPRLLLAGGPRWHAPTPERLDQVATALGDAALEGRTVHGAAIELALLLQPDAVYLLTDGEDLSAERIASLRAAGRGTMIHVVKMAEPIPTSARLP